EPRGRATSAIGPAVEGAVDSLTKKHGAPGTPRPSLWSFRVIPGTATLFQTVSSRVPGPVSGTERAGMLHCWTPTALHSAVEASGRVIWPASRRDCDKAGSQELFLRAPHWSVSISTRT